MPHMSESKENYIKAIHELSCQHGSACITDIATRLGVTKASASRAVSLLAELGLVRRDGSRHVVLTEAGKRQAGEVEGRFKTVREFWMRVLRASPDAAALEACRLEHVLSDASLYAMRQTLDGGL